MRMPLLASLLLASPLSQAAIITTEIPYQGSDGTQLIGYYAYDDAIQGPRPGVVVVHEWWGLNDYAKRRAHDLAGLGYSALAIDMYGGGKHTEHPKDAMAFMQAALANSDAAKARFVAGLELLKIQPQTNPAQLAAIGYCFGGKVVLDAARQSVPLAGVASFHGALGTATRATPGSVKGKILVEHGGADSMVSAADVEALKQELTLAGADYQFVVQPEAKHSFSNPDADAHKGHGLDVGYNKQADERSWADLKAFLRTIFQQP